MEQELKAIDVGRLGFSGFHDRMLEGFTDNTQKSAIACAMWVWMPVLSAHLETYKLSPHVTAALLLKLALGLWTAKVVTPLLTATWFAMRWLRLEMAGVQWVRRNDHNFRVTYFRPKDGSLKFDQSTRAERLSHELQVMDWRRKTFWNSGIRLAAYGVIYVLIPSAYVFSFELMNAEVHTFLDRWRFVYWAQLVWCYLYVIPELVSFCTVGFEWFAYTSGAQYIPGAKLRDPVIPDKTLETMRAEMSHGAAPVVDPEEAARRLGGTK